jgi:prepilin-type processing-associated H-X9-DG protein
MGINLPGRVPGSSDGVFSSYSRSGAVNVLRADGSVQSIDKDVDPEVLKRELSVSGNPKDIPPAK